ncbi:MAG: ATP-binding protein [Pirellulales bacterium]
MRWPIRAQIMLPMLLVMLISLVGVSVLNAYFSVQQTKGQIVGQLTNVAETLQNLDFPLTDRSLTQARGLTGAEFTLVNSEDEPIASTIDRRHIADIAKLTDVDASAEVKLGPLTEVGDARFYHGAVRITGRAAINKPLVLHILYPEKSYTEAFRQAIKPPLLVGGVALLLVVILGAVIASRVTHPLRNLGTQMDRIAEGDFRDVPLPRRDDEVKDLAESINEMVGMLGHYEDNVRRNEQLRTIGQLGAGIAHQMRNAATGCRMALDIHRTECPTGENSETIDVATRQLALMEKYLQRFLSLGRTSIGPHQDLDICELVENVLPLVKPAAQHVGVRLEWTPPADRPRVHGHAENLEQVIINLLLNAVEAVSQHTLPDAAGSVNITVGTESTKDGERVTVEVDDSGPGPADDVRNRIFEPLVTEKPDGTGLGLYVAKEIVDQHGGTITWQRRKNRTCFVVSLPTFQPEVTRAETVSG